MNTLTADQEARILALLRLGRSLRRIERETGHRRETIAAYGRRAGLCGDAIALEPRRSAPRSAFDAHRATIARGLAEGRTLRDIHDDLVRRYAVAATYSALKRYVRVTRPVALPTASALALVA